VCFAGKHNWLLEIKHQLKSGAGHGFTVLFMQIRELYNTVIYRIITFSNFEISHVHYGSWPFEKYKINQIHLNENVVY
jgi:hypothetical protein